MHLVYIDDSYDDVSIPNGKCVVSALVFPESKWNESFKLFKEYRRQLNKKHGIYIAKEFHATRFVAGRGQIANKDIPKWTRCEIFKETLGKITQLPDVRLITAMQPRGQLMLAFERLVNRLNMTLQAKWKSNALLICDYGHEMEYTKMLRKLRVYNPVQSRFGAWEDGKTHKNFPLDNILEDPVFKNSEDSYHVQLADFCAYAALRKVSQIPSRNKYGLHEAYEILKPIWVPETSTHPDCIIR